MNKLLIRRGTRFGYWYSVKGIIGLVGWRPTKKWATNAGLKVRAKYYLRVESYNNPVAVID